MSVRSIHWCDGTSNFLGSALGRSIVPMSQLYVAMGLEAASGKVAFRFDSLVFQTAPGGGYIGEMWLSEMEPKLAAAGAKLGHGETSGIVDMGNRWMILQRMPRDFKADADDLFERASALKAGGDIKGALEKDQQALRIYPYFLRALIFMGATLGENGEVQRGS